MKRAMPLTNGQLADIRHASDGKPATNTVRRLLANLDETLERNAILEEALAAIARHDCGRAKCERCEELAAIVLTSGLA